MQAKLRVSAPRRSQLIGSTIAAPAVRDFSLRTTGEGAIFGPTTTPDPGNVGSKASQTIFRSLIAGLKAGYRSWCIRDYF
jgi:hypothetical protein